MPPRWPRKPDPHDPAYRRLRDRINFAVHIAGFAAGNSSIWFLREIKYSDWTWTSWMTGIWVSVLLIHFVYIAYLADYSVESNG